MEQLYESIGISRQGFHKHRQKVLEQLKQDEKIVARVEYHRLDHPRMGARPLYQMMSQDQQDAKLLRHLGRDRFENTLISNGLRVRPIRIFHKTTYRGATRFDNLVQGLQIKSLNHVWVSDITYYRLRNQWAYLTFILDLYSKRCLGYALSDNMIAENTVIPALQMALKNRAIPTYHFRLFFHSDGGGQYIDHAFVQILKDYQIDSSMSESVYENPHIERFHGTAKNDYLIPWGVNSLKQLRQQLPKFVQLYNFVRPHEQLKYQTPVAFEQSIQQIPLCQRPIVLFKEIT